MTVTLNTSQQVFDNGNLCTNVLGNLTNNVA